MKPTLPTSNRPMLSRAARALALGAAALPTFASAAGSAGASLPFGLSEGYALAAGAIGMWLFMAGRRGSR